MRSLREPVRLNGQVRAISPLVVVASGGLFLWGLLTLAGQEFWWQYPIRRAWLVVTAYWSGVALALWGCLAAGRLLIEATYKTPFAIRLANVTCLALGGWLLLELISDDARGLKEYYWRIASGAEKPAEIRFNPDTGRIEIRGELRAGSAARFKEVLLASPTARVVEVGGPGGLIEEARWISHQIEQQSMDTLITGKCASACVDMFAAGRQRVMLASATVGLHSASSSIEDAAVIAEENQLFSERLYRIGVEPRFLMIGTETPADGIWINTARQAYLAGLATEVRER